MPLPYPHGASAGQIAHNSFYDTGVTPGSTGGKFIGWGEEGTSGNANRAHWALSENIDYLYTKMSANKAIPKGQAVASGHGGINKYQLSGDVFVGDATYPGSAGVGDPEGLYLLFSVMDEQYNELTDGSGHEVIVYIVRDSTETTGVYKTSGGFATNPWIYFEADGSPYTIPDSQEIRILYGEKGNMENLPVDAFTRFKLNSAAEAEAGTLLQDGTRPMTGDLDLDGHKVINVDEMLGETGSNDLLVRAFKDLKLQGDQQLYLKDQNLTGSGVKLAQPGDYGIYDTGYGEHESIVKSLNSKTHATEGLCYLGLAAGYLNTVSMPGSGGIISWAATGIMAAGEHFLAPAGSLNMASPMQPSGWYYLACDGFSIYLRSSGSLQTGDVALYYFNWDGANIVEYRKLARQYNGRVDTMEITVGGRGSDFSSTQLQEALNYAAHVGALSATADVPGTPVIKVKTGASWSTTLQIRSDVIIRGEGPSRTILRSNCGTNNDAMKGNGFRVIIEDLAIQHDSDQMVSWVAMIRNFGPYSEFRRLELKAGTSFNKGFSIAFLVDASQYSYYCTFDSIDGYDNLTTGFIRGCESGLSGGRLSDSLVRNCNIGFTASSDYAIITVDKMMVEDCQFWADEAGGLGEYAIVSGPGSRIESNSIWGWAPSGLGIGIYIYWNGGGELYYYCNNNNVYTATIGIRVYLNQVARFTCVNIYGGKLTDCDTGISCDPNATSTDSYVNIYGVSFDMMNVRGVFVNNGNIRVRVSHCGFMDLYGMGVQVTAGPTQVSHCYFAGWGTGGALNNCVDFAGLSGFHMVNNCKFGTGAPAGGHYISTAAPVTVYGNQIEGPGGTNTSIGVQLVGGSDNSYVGHNIFTGVRFGVRVEGTNFIFILGAGNRIEGNRFFGMPSTGWGIWIDGAEFQTILGNEFSNMDGGGVLVGHLSGGVLGDAKSNMIANNTFYNVRGKNSDNIIKVLEGANGSGRMTSITGNKLYLCGHNDVGGTNYQYQIQGDAADCLIANNMVAWLAGDTSDVCAGINWSGPCSIVGNYIMHDFSNIGVTRPSSMYGIVCHSQNSLIASNFIDFKNTSPDSYPTSVHGIYVSVTDVAIIGNFIRDWYQTPYTGTNQYAIRADSLGSGVVIGNWSSWWRITCSGSSTPVLGNYSGGIGVFRTGGTTYPPNNAYYVETSNIFDTMNY